MRGIWIIAIAALVAVLAFSQWTYWESVTEKQRVIAQSAFPIVGQPAPNFHLPLLGGGTGTLADYQGRPVIINFWTTSCKVCKKLFPLLNSFDRDYGEQIAVLSVCSGGTLGKAIEVARDYGLTFPSLYDAEKEVVRAYQPQEQTVRREITAFPFTVFIDESGIVIYAKVGTFTSIEDLLEVIRTLGMEID